MKTQFSLPDVARFVENTEQAKPDSLHPLVEGHISQAFSFETDQGKYVVRLSEADDDFKADKFAFEHFGKILPIPAVREVGAFNGEAFYCVTDFVEGKTSNTLSDEELARALPNIQQSLATMFDADISFSTGYGEVDTSSGNAHGTSWREQVAAVERQGIDSFKANAAHIGLLADLVEAFFEQYRANLPFASETRRLLHGDPAFDNMLVRNDEVVAVIDWAQLGYGDWMSDFARLDFWWPGRYGEKNEFAKTYGLEADHLDERQALYWATNALWTIKFADEAKSESTVQWLHEYLQNKLIA